MPTIKEIAKACNVSVATVSNIINHKGSVGDATRERVEKVIREMNYTPNYVAKNLKTKNTRSIGVIAEDMTVFALPDIIDGITEYCEEAMLKLRVLATISADTPACRSFLADCNFSSLAFFIEASGKAGRRNYLCGCP